MNIDDIIDQIPLDASWLDITEAIQTALSTPEQPDEEQARYVLIRLADLITRQDTGTRFPV